MVTVELSMVCAGTDGARTRQQLTTQLQLMSLTSIRIPSLKVNLTHRRLSQDSLACGSRHWTDHNGERHSGQIQRASWTVPAEIQIFQQFPEKGPNKEAPEESLANISRGTRASRDCGLKTQGCRGHSRRSRLVLSVTTSCILHFPARVFASLFTPPASGGIKV